SEEHTSELQSRRELVCRLLLEKKKAVQPSAADQYASPVARPDIPEELPPGPSAAVLVVRLCIQTSGRVAEAGIDGPAPDSGAADDLEALPVEARIDAANRARGSWGKTRQVERAVQLRPGVRGADGLDPSQRRQNRNSRNQRPGHGLN